MIINATDQQLDSIAGEIKANIAKYSFDGVDLDIENWWNYNQADNQLFASNLAKMVKILRKSLDDDSKTQQKPIMLTVGWEAAGPVNQMNGNSAYAGTMVPFFTDSEAMNALSDINIMSYNTGIPNFYSRYDLI